jgi:hypothetical protein
VPMAYSVFFCFFFFLRHGSDVRAHVHCDVGAYVQSFVD